VTPYREFSTDQPQRDPRRRMGTLKARRTLHTYLVDYGNGSEWAYYPGDDLLPLGSYRTTVFDPAADQWWIRPFGGEYLTYRSFDADFNLEGMATVKVSRSGIGPPSFGPLNNLGNASDPLRIAVSPDGSYMVAVDLPTSAPFTDRLRMYAWEGNGWGTTVIDEVTEASFPQDIAMSANGDLAVALSASPWVKVYPTTSAGFGAAYSTFGSGSPGYDVESVEWHPSGTALIWGNTAGSGGWAFTTGVGFGSAYAPYNGTGFNPSSVAKTVRFAPSGDHIAVWGGSSGLGTVTTLWATVVPFDLVTGMGAVFTEPVSGEFESENGLATPTGFLAITDTHMYTLIIESYPVPKLYRYPYAAGALSPGTLSADGAATSTIFQAHPILISRTGQFLAWSDETQNELINVYAIESDGSLTEIGTIAPDPGLGGLPSGHHGLGWR
jgi:hypothetical protein